MQTNTKQNKLLQTNFNYCTNSKFYLNVLYILFYLVCIKLHRFLLAILDSFDLHKYFSMNSRFQSLVLGAQVVTLFEMVRV